MTPPDLAARPAIMPGAERCWAAFLDLARERPVGAAPQAIALAALRSWLDEEGIADPVLRGEIREVVLLLDAHWLDHVRRRLADSKEHP